MMPYSFVIFQGVPNPLCPLWIRAWKELENNMLATWPETPHLKQSNQLALSQRDACRVKQGAKYCITKQGPKSHKKHKQWDRHTKTMCQKQQNHRFRTDSSRNYRESTDQNAPQ